MVRDRELSRLDQERLGLWTHGGLLVALTGVLMVTVLSAKLCLSHRACLLDAPPERINPNTASVASLVRLPGIGRARALDIVDYRDHQQDGPVFGSPQDLEQIRGIGPKTSAKLAPWLTFNANDAKEPNDANGKE